jgi:hypothetical protein
MYLHVGLHGESGCSQELGAIQTWNHMASGCVDPSRENTKRMWSGDKNEDRARMRLWAGRFASVCTYRHDRDRAELHLGGWERGCLSGEGGERGTGTVLPVGVDGGRGGELTVLGRGIA